MALAQRVRRLERTIGVCPECQGKGRVVATFPDDEDQEPEGCPVCGELTHIKVVYVDAPPLLERRK